MMRRIFKPLSVLALFASMFSFTGCDLSKPHLCPSFILGYVELKGIELKYDEATDNCIWICSGPDNGGEWYTLQSEGENKDVYDFLCSKHKDLDYNQYRNWIEFPVPGHCASDFLSIEIISDADYDASHPAGTNLADIVRFMSFSPYPHILSGYSDYFHYDASKQSPAFDKYMKNYLSGSAVFPIDKMASELMPEDLTLLELSPMGMLHFESEPTLAKEHDITVKMHADDGKVFTASIQMLFE